MYKILLELRKGVKVINSYAILSVSYNISEVRAKVHLLRSKLVGVKYALKFIKEHFWGKKKQGQLKKVKLMVKI